MNTNTPGGKEEIPGEDRQYRPLLDASIADTLRTAVRLVAKDPGLALAGARILAWQKKAAMLRGKAEKEGQLVPPAIFVSVTAECNLSCRGCYMRGTHAAPAQNLDNDRLMTLVREAAELGVSILVFAGGEPLLRRTEILSLARSFPQILFAVFTNGLLINDAMAREMRGTKNLVPMISVEGFREETDARRGTGVYDRLRDACASLKKNGVFFGCSVTVTCDNAGLVISDRFVREMTGAGARAIVFVAYVPVEPGTGHLVLDSGTQRRVNERCAELSRNYPALFIGFPGDEDAYGGCLAAGRGFVHISASGDLEACPAAPFSDRNVTDVSLREALGSPLLVRIRANPLIMTETGGGCALLKNRDWLQDLAGQNPAGERSS
jgi:MoaA/NifB/PqqE/SkfB family radical SAM enzyme